MKRLLAVGAVVVAALLVWHPPAAAPPVAIATAAPFASHTPRGHRRPAPPATLVVYVAGAVRRPGLYTVAAKSRANDAVRLAGGFRPDADPAGVNLAAALNDGDEVRVPVAGAARTSRSRAGVIRSRRPAASRAKTSTPVELNAASASQLARVPGIGAALAARIVELRERDGAYETLDQLLDVAGMTPARLDRAAPFLYL